MKLMIAIIFENILIFLRIVVQLIGWEQLSRFCNRTIWKIGTAFSNPTVISGKK